MIKEAIVKIVGKQDLTYDEAYAVMNEIMSGETTLTQNAAFLAALSTKSAKAETTDEIAGCAAAMRDHAVKVNPGMDVLEIVGTGGDGAQSFNISTTSALVAAAGGVKVAKHGRLPGGAGGEHSAKPRPLCGAAEGSGHVLLLRPEIPHLHEIRGRHPQRAGGCAPYSTFLAPSPTPPAPPCSCWASTTNIWSPR